MGAALCCSPIVGASKVADETSAAKYLVETEFSSGASVAPNEQQLFVLQRNTGEVVVIRAADVQKALRHVEQIGSSRAAPGDWRLLPLSDLQQRVCAVEDGSAREG